MEKKYSVSTELWNISRAKKTGPKKNPDYQKEDTK